MKTFSDWMEEEGIPGIFGINTGALTKKIREKGTILRRIVFYLSTDISKYKFLDPNERHLVAEVSTKVYNYF